MTIQGAQNSTICDMAGWKGDLKQSLIFGSVSK